MSYKIVVLVILTFLGILVFVRKGMHTKIMSWNISLNILFQFLPPTTITAIGETNRWG